MNAKLDNRIVETGARVALVLLFALGCFLWGRSSEQAETDTVARDVDRQMMQGEYGKLYGALKAHFPEDFIAERDGLVRLTRANAGQDDFAVFLRISQDQLEARHVDDFAAAGGPALAKFRAAEIAWKEALSKPSPDDCGFTPAVDTAPAHGARNSKQVSVAVGDMDYAMVMAMADGRVAKVHRRAPSGEDFSALQAALARQGLMAPDRSATDICTTDVRVLKAIDSLPPEQADVFTVAAFRNVVKAASEQAGRTAA